MEFTKLRLCTWGQNRFRYHPGEPCGDAVWLVLSACREGCRDEQLICDSHFALFRQSTLRCSECDRLGIIFAAANLDTLARRTGGHWLTDADWVRY